MSYTAPILFYIDKLPYSCYNTYEGETMQKILIIEDDKVIARTLKEHLCKWDYDADFVVDFKT